MLLYFLLIITEFEIKDVLSLLQKIYQPLCSLRDGSISKRLETQVHLSHGPLLLLGSTVEGMFM